MLISFQMTALIFLPTAAPADFITTYFCLFHVAFLIIEKAFQDFHLQTF